ncbi:MAG: hypothetical protein RL653_1863 [Pseudomonadota bacterium]
MSFARLAAWLDAESYAFPEDPAELVDVLRRVALDLEGDPAKLQAVYAAKAQGNASDLARILSLFNADDEALQQQGFELLLSSDSEDLWNAILHDAEFDHEVNAYQTLNGYVRAHGLHHRTLENSKYLHRALLHSPFYDYSGVTRLYLKAPFHESLADLKRLTELTELTIHFQDSATDASFSSLEGLRELEKLVKLTLVLDDKRGFHFGGLMTTPAWTENLGNIRELTVFGDSRGCSSFFPMRLLRHLPKLERFRSECRLDFEKYDNAYQGRLEIVVPDGPLSHYLPTGGEKPLRADLVRIFFSWTEQQLRPGSFADVCSLDLSQINLEGQGRVELAYDYQQVRWSGRMPANLLISRLDRLATHKLGRVAISGDIHLALAYEHVDHLPYIQFSRKDESKLPRDARLDTFFKPKGKEVVVDQEAIRALYGARVRRMAASKLLPDHRFFSWEHLFLDLATYSDRGVLVRELPTDYLQYVPSTVRSLLLCGDDHRLADFGFVARLEHLEALTLRGFSKLTISSLESLAGHQALKRITLV